METNLSNFFAGSENLYKYLVSIGMLLIVLTVYYPLKEKQELEILKIKLEEDVQVLNFKIKENQTNVLNLQVKIGQNSPDIQKLESLSITLNVSKNIWKLKRGKIISNFTIYFFGFSYQRALS